MTFIAGREIDLTDLDALEAALLEVYQGLALNPDWAEFDAEWKHVHDWRTYVSAEARALWDRLDLKARVVIIHNCVEQASNEEWE